LRYGERLVRDGVEISFHPAGHILGSAQIRIAYQGYVLVISGDYKTEPDPTCAPFELVRCHEFISEATFGLPIYRWQSQQMIFEQINHWWRANAAEGKASVLYCYALGKAQRVIAGVDPTIGPIYTHGAVESMNEAYRAAGISLPSTASATTAPKSAIRGALIVAPPYTRGTSWMRRFGEHVSAFASGWMRIRGTRRRQAVDRGFTLSDHADWDNLNATIRATEATRVGIMHGYIPELVRWLGDQGVSTYGLETSFRDESAEADPNVAPEGST
jgi:putative mRNA 3-end processing factor